MLKQVRQRKPSATGGHFAIVASRYNDRYVAALLRGAQAELRQAHATARVVRVPGAYEIPVVAKALARRAGTQLDGIICLGVILRGETAHAAHIGEAVSTALMQIQLEHEMPVIHEVLLLENVDQARKRCLDPRHNRGREAAQTALAMAAVMRSLRNDLPI
ncbi:MAG: 6,7-dimethyl-8-ribityllumazine synthase [Verrucomicrobia bacterium]|jgi:6,7-dimethyl-8-ribityllumazine synthase|nr:6,7-dimethyl-8-ribityllumazine synthase [Verrucomicrobiota bacterium]